MKNPCCCNDRSINAAADQSWTRTIRRVASWIVPSVVLAAMPKCPLCLAAYVALFTGFGVSLAAAKFAWWSIGIGCSAVLLYLVATTLRGLLTAK
jgi:hypothetical protein